ncbi:MAG: GAF domain-containing protein [Desulfobacteraceae bacterium]|nr:GAF domain-containing protein [Desulfobacteraceae bacterium]
MNFPLWNQKLRKQKISKLGPIKDKPRKSVLFHIIKNPLLRILLTMMLTIAIVFPMFSIYFIFPQFVNLLTNHLKNEAIKNANHLKYITTNNKTGKINLPISLDTKNNLLQIKYDLHLEKIKIFSKNGQTIFSTNPRDIGELNTHNYFHTLVAGGKIITHLVQKDSITLEGRPIKVEVIETYLPLMVNDIFGGAIEVYSDITNIKNALTKLLNQLKLTIVIFSIIIVLFLFVLLIKASRNIIEKNQADKALGQIHERQEELIIERTANLIEANNKLNMEIEERRFAQTALKHSHDTQAIVNKLLKDSLKKLSLQELLTQCLDLILSLPWLSFQSKGCIFIVEDDPLVLVMKTQRGFSKELEKECSLLPFGKCLCGRAALSKEILFANHMDDRHDILIEKRPDHGNYCVPILIKDQVFGLISIYVKKGHKQNPEEEKFLKTIANTLAGVLIQRHRQIEKNKYPPS